MSTSMLSHARVAPFVRLDDAHRARVLSRVQLVLMLPVALVRLAVIVALAFGLWALARMCAAAHLALPVAAQRLAARAALFTLGFYWIRVERLGSRASAPIPPLIVANHQSYIDVLVLMWLFAPSFVAKAPVRQVPLIGGLTEMLQCLFVNVERRRDDAVRGPHDSPTSRAIAARLGACATRGARPLAVFPEGTTTNGSRLLRFKTGAFVSAPAVLPVAIEYDRSWFSPCWESLAVHVHLLWVLTRVWQTVAVTILPPMTCALAHERAEPPELYAQRVGDVLAARLGLAVADASREHKLAVHEWLRGVLDDDGLRARLA